MYKAKKKKGLEPFDLKCACFDTHRFHVLGIDVTMIQLSDGTLPFNKQY